MSLREYLRGLLGVDATQRNFDASARDLENIQQSVRSLTREMRQLRGLVLQQTDLTTEALQRAGWQDEDEREPNSIRKVLRAIATPGDIIAGPWTGEVGFELMYWIPFLNWLAADGALDSRLIVVSRGGAAPWYRHLTTRYVDLLELMTPDEFRERTAGPKKQLDRSHRFDREVFESVKTRLGLGRASLVHPAAMYRLFEALWRKRATIDLVSSFSSYRPLLAPDPDEAQDQTIAQLPRDYVAAKFYFSKAFPESPENRRFVRELLERITRQVPVVLLSTGVRVDEHIDFRADGGSNLLVVDAHAVPQKNLELQTRVICGARGFIGTYGGFSYLAPFYGVRSLTFFSRRFGFESHHLDLAEGVFDRLLPGGFVAIDRRAIDLVEPAVERWTTAGVAPADDAIREDRVAAPASS